MKLKTARRWGWFFREPISETRHHWEGCCPVCGRFQNSRDVCGECLEDGWDLERQVPVNLGLPVEADPSGQLSARQVAASSSD